ncbi:MAG: hypothetical protein ACKO6K_06000 [Chitinophagaceae bacterium]
MINGFTLEIENQTERELTVPLFQDFQVPNGIIIKAIGADYHYDALNRMAKTEGFVGAGLMSTFLTECSIYKQGEKTKLNYSILNNGLERFEIAIDGDSQYITITIPANIQGVFKLMQKL